MNLKILVPQRIFKQAAEVTRIVAETSEGSIGLLPRRLDCAAALVPGILVYEIGAVCTYVAVDGGVLVKAGADVLISTRRAAAGKDLSALKAVVRQEFLNVDEREQAVRSALAKMEAGMLAELKALSHAR